MVLFRIDNRECNFVNRLGGPLTSLPTSEGSVTANLAGVLAFDVNTPSVLSVTQHNKAHVRSRGLSRCVCQNITSTRCIKLGGGAHETVKDSSHQYLSLLPVRPSPSHASYGQRARKGTAMDTQTASGSLPSEQEIAARAYEIFLSRGASHGHDLDDWLQAEQELTAEIADTTKARSARA